MQRNAIRSRLGLVLAASIFIAIGIGAVVGTQRLMADASSVQHSHQVISQLNEAKARLREAEAAQRGYLLTESPSYLATYQAAIDALPATQRRLADLLEDNRTQKLRAQAFSGLINQRLEQMTHTLVRHRDGGLDGARKSMSRETIEVSNLIRSQAAEMRADEEQLLAHRAASTEVSATLVTALALLGIPAGLAAILLVYLWLVREIRHRTRAESLAAAANQNLRIGVQQLERGTADLQALNRFSSLLQSCRETSEAFDVTERTLRTLFPGTSGTLYRMRNSQDQAEALARWGRHRDTSHDSLAPGDCWGLRRGQAHLVASERDPVCAHARKASPAGVAQACFPLSAQGVQLGLLHLSDQEPDFLARRDIIEAVAEQLSMALSNLNLQERLRVQSIREPLTGLYNRRYLEEAAEREFSRCRRRKLPISLLMLDIDNFKAFNDVHGHAGGDAVLSAFGKLLRETSRSDDIACRFGGEEFTLIMPETTSELARQRAEAIRTAVQAMEVVHQGKVLPRLTVSIGVAGCVGGTRSPEAVMHDADEALYRAKRGGRNRVEVATRVASMQDAVGQ